MTTNTNTKKNILLIDSNSNYFPSILYYIDLNKSDFIVFNSNENTYNDVIQLIRNNNNNNNKYESIGIFQNNSDELYYQFSKKEEQCLLENDSSLTSWNEYIKFLNSLKTEFSFINLDLIVCALYSETKWKYVIDTLETQIQIQISTSDNINQNGYWFFETNKGINLRDVYFINQQILEITPQISTTKKLLLIDNRIKDIELIINSMNDNTYCLVFNYFYDTYETLLSKIRFLSGSNRYILDNFFYEEPQLPVRKDSEGNHCTTCEEFSIDDLVLSPATLESEYLNNNNNNNNNDNKLVFFQREKKIELNSSIIYRKRPFVNITDLDAIYQIAQSSNQVTNITFDCIGIIQHTIQPYLGYKLINNIEDIAVIENIQITDADLLSWSSFSSFIQSLKTLYQITTLDLMACALYANPDWKYIIDNLSIKNNITIRASNDNTGSSNYGGNWILETNDINLTNVYFTDKIYEWQYVLATYIDNRFYGLRFNDSMYATRGYDARLKIAAGTSNFTIETWYYETAARYNCTIVDMGDYNYTFQIRNLNVGGAGGLSFTNRNLNGGNDWMYAESAVVPVAQWSHLAITRSGSTFTFYVNGVARQTFTNSASLFSNNSTFAIGWQSPDTCSCNRMRTDCVLYDIRLWNVARTASEIQMNRNRVIPANSSGLVANYLCTDNSNTFNDRTSNALHATIQSYDSTRWTNSLVPIPNVGFLINNGYSLTTYNSTALNALTHFDNITNTDFSNINLSNVNFTNADLTGCNFTSANLSNAVLNGANLTNANLTNATLDATYLIGANLTGATTTGSTIASAITTTTLTKSNSSAFYLTPPAGATTTYGPTWSQLGSTIFGSNAGDALNVLSISKDGTVIAVSSPGNDSTGTDRGFVKVLKWNGSSWNQLGGTFYGISNNDLINVSKLSSDGNYVAFRYNDSAVSNKGFIGIFVYDSNKTVEDTNVNSASYGPIGWSRVGGFIYNEFVGDNATSIGLSGNGQIIALGCEANDGTSGSSTDNRGSVRVYKYDPNKLSEVTDQANANFGPVGWTRMGTDIDGENTGDNFGAMIELSTDGTVIAAAAVNSDINGTDNGQIRVFKWNTSSSTWVQRGRTIYGQLNSSGDTTLRFAYALSLSADGNIIACGNSNYVSYGGITKTLQWNSTNNDYQILGQQLKEYGDWQLSGHSVSLSSDGQILAVGAYDADRGLSNNGTVRVYRLSNFTTTLISSPPTNMTGYSFSDTIYRMTITGNSSTGSVWGTNLYTADSNIARAAVHAGVIVNGETKEIYLKMERFQYKYFGTTRNGVTTTDFTDNSMTYLSYYFMDSPKLWVQIGNEIAGQGANYYIGGFAALSGNGTTLAVTGFWSNNIGLVQVYSLSSTDNYSHTSSASNIAEVYGDIVIPKTPGFTTIASKQSSTITTSLLAITGTAPTFSSFPSVSKFTNDSQFTLTLPESNSTGAFTLTTGTVGATLKYTRNALRFDGVNDAVVLNSYPTLNSTNQLTLEGWIFVTTFPSNIITLNDHSSIDILADGKISTWIRPSNLVWFNIQSSSAVPLNTWFYIAIVKNDNGYNKIYINNNIVNNTADTSSGNLNTCAGISFAADAQTASSYSNIILSEFRIWSVARTEKQIRDNYNREVLSNSTGLQIYYKFNQGTAGGNNAGLTTLTDSTSNNYHGTLTNFALSGTTSNYVTGITMLSKDKYTITNETPAIATINPDISVNALNFNGTNNYIDLVSNITELSSANFTIECWIKTTGTRMGILNCQDSDNPPNWEAGEKSFYLDSSGKPAFVGFGNNYILSTQAVDDNKWHHVAVVWSYSTSIGFIYIDGKDRTNKLNNLPYQAINNNTGRFIVGVPNNSEAINYFSGSICELRIWSIARTASQIYQNFRRILNGDESGLVCYNRLNQGTANGSNSGLTTATNNMLSGGFAGSLSGFSLVSNTSNWVDGITLRPNKDVTITGPGVATITAIQEESGIYDVGTTTATVTVALKNFSSILTLDGDNDAINVGVPAWTYSTQFRTTMTVECWFKTSDTNNQKIYTQLVGRNISSGVSSSAQFAIYMLPTGEIGFGLTNNNNNLFNHTTTLTYKDTQWHHVVGTYDSATGTKIIYIDGVAVKTDINSGFGLSSNNSTVKLIFGSDDSAQTDRQFRGSLSDIRIWSVVRTASEISNNYRQRLIGNETGLLGYWKLNQGYGSGWGTYTIAIDSTSNRSNGTLTNFATPSNNWTLSNLAFLPRISDITLGSKNGLYSLSDSSFTFIDPLSNSFGNFLYAINSAVATLSNGTATTKTVYTTSGAITLPTLSLFDFPEIASLADWEINISFIVTGGATTWRPLIGDMYNEINSSRGWGVWVSSATPPKIHWSFVGNIFEPAQTLLSLNTPYILNVVKSSAGTITLTLQNVSGLHDSTLVSSISNLVASYSFDSNVNDSSGNNNTLTNVSAVTYNTSDYKRGLGAASFNGSNYFEIANDGRFSPDNFTVALWIKPVSHTIYQSIASCRGSSPWRGWMLYIGPSGSGSNLEIWSSTDGSNFTGQTSVISNFGTLNKWIHLAFTLNKSTSALVVYMNGNVVTTTTLGYTNNTATNLRIGAGANEQGALFNLANGTLMDDFRFYNKVLSASEIASLVSSISNLVASYNFDSNGSDSSPNNNNLTNVNTVTFNTSDYKRGSGAASFSGNNHFQIINDGKFSPDNFTVACWIKPVDSSGNYQSIATCRDGYSFRGWIIYINPSNNLEFITGTGSGATTWSYGSEILLNGIGTINTWVHIAFTLSKSTSTVIAYINGTQQATFTRTYVNNTSYPLRIGAGGDMSYGELFLRNGTLVDDFRFYNKVLSASEIGTIVADSSFSSLINIGSNVIGKGPVTIGGWRSVGENFSGTISNVNVKVPTNQRLVTLVSNTSGTPATITATQDSFMDFDTGTKTASLSIGNITPTLTNFTVASQNFGTTPFNLVAPTSNSPGTFTYTSSNTAVATISGSTVTIVGAGTTTIEATQASSGSYVSGTVTTTFTVNPIAPTLSNFTVAAKNYGDTSFNLVAPTTNSSGTFTYTSSNIAVATISGSTVTILGGGTTTVTATQSASGNYTSGTIVTTFVVSIPSGISFPTFTKESNQWYFNFQYGGSTQLTLFTINLTWKGGFNGTISFNQDFSSLTSSYGTNKYLTNFSQSVLIGNTVTATINYTESGVAKQTITTFVPNPVTGGPYTTGISNFNTNILPATCTATIPSALDQQRVDAARGWHYTIRFTETATGTITSMASFYASGGLQSSFPVTIPMALYGKTFTCQLFISNDGGGFSGDFIVQNYNTTNNTSFTIPHPTGIYLTQVTELWHTGMNWQTGGPLEDTRLYRVRWFVGTTALDINSPNYVSKVRVNIKLNSDSGYRFTGVYNYADGVGYSMFHSSIRSPLGQNIGTWIVDIRTENSDATITTSYQTLSQYGGVPAYGNYFTLDQLAAEAGTSIIQYGENVASTFKVSNFAQSSGYTWTLNGGQIYKYLTNVLFKSASMYGTSISTYKHKLELINPDSTKTTIGLYDMNGSSPNITMWPLNPSSTYTVKITIVDSSQNEITNFFAMTNGYDTATFQSLSLTVPAAPSPTLSNFTVSAKNYGAVPFDLTAPTSNSSGAFTYTSSNTDVATISGITVTIVGGGTTTITATQADTGTYTSGTITASLVVSPIAPTLSNFTVTTKYFGQPTFTITAPTTNSNGTFTYSSSNTAVATISGSTVTILSVGTSTITATQASTANYTQGSVTTTLTVNSYENANLTGLDLSGTNLTGLNLSNSTLTNVTSGSIIGNPTLPTNYILVNGYIIGPNVNLTNVNLSSQNLTNANFTGVNLTGANLTLATLTGVISGSITGTPTLSASYSIINGYILGPSVNLSSKNLSNMNLLASNLTNVNLNSANIDNTDFSNTTLTGVKSGSVIGAPILPNNYYIIKGCIVGSNVDLTGAVLTNINYSKVSYNAFDDFISGPTPQSTSNDWQYFEVNTDRSSASLLSNWQIGTGNQDQQVIYPYGQWDNNRAFGAYPSVQKVNDSGVIQSGYGTSFTGPALVMHPDDSSTYNVGMGYKNTTGNTININIDIALSFLFPSMNSDGVNYFIQRGLINDTRYKIYISSNIPAASTNTFTFNKKNIELQNGEFIYLILNRVGSFHWDFTRVVFNVTINDFKNLTLSSVNLTNANLSGTNLLNTTLTNCNVTNTDFRTATLTNLISSDLTGTPLLSSNYNIVNNLIIGPSVNLTNVNLSNQNLTNINLSGTNLTGANLTNATLTGVLSGSVTGTPTLSTNYTMINGYVVGPNVNLTNATLSSQNLTNKDLSGVNLTGANLTGATLTGVVSGSVTGTPTLSATYSMVNGYVVGPNVNLTNATLSSQNLTNAVLTGANLTNTNLTGATLTGVVSGSTTGTPTLSTAYTMINGYVVGPSVNLTNAILNSQNLTNKDLSGANLTGANLTGATLTGVVSGSVTGTPTLSAAYNMINGYVVGPNVNLTNATLSNQNLTNKDLSGANLTGANLTGATLTGVTSGSVTGTATFSASYSMVNGYVVGPSVNLTNATLSNQNLSSKDLSGATLTGANLSGITVNTSTVFTNAVFTNVTTGNITGTTNNFPTNYNIIGGYVIGPAVNLVNATLSGANLSTKNLTDVNLTGANLSGANLSNVTINSNTNFTNSTLTNVSSGSLSGTTSTFPTNYNIIGGYVVGPSVNLSNATLSGLNLSSKILTGVNFTNANLTNVILTGSTIDNSTNITNATLTNVTTGSLIGTSTNFSSSYNLINGYVVGPSVNLTGANLSGQDLTNKDLSSANLTNVNLTSSTLTGLKTGSITGTPTLSTDYTVVNNYILGPSVNLTNANLANQNLTNVNLSGANLSGTVLTDATLTGLITSSITGVPTMNTAYTIINGYVVGPSVNLTNANLSGQDLTGKDLTNVNLSNANLSNATTTNIILSNTNINNANITNITFSNIQKAQLLKNTNNRSISNVQISNLSGTDILSLIPNSSISTINNISSVVFKVIPPSVQNTIDLSVVTSGAFYVPSSTNESVIIDGKTYYSTSSTIINSSTGLAVETLTFGTKIYKLFSGSIIGVELNLDTYKIYGVGFSNIFEAKGTISSFSNSITAQQNLAVVGTSTLTGNVGINKSPSDTYKVDVLGTVRASLFTTTSDYRIKEDINNIEDNIDELKPVKYKNKLNNKMEYGFIAHEVQDIFPEIVQGEKDGEEYQSINYSGLIPILVNEIKKLKEEIKNLKK